MILTLLMGRLFFKLILNFNINIILETEKNINNLVLFSFNHSEKIYESCFNN